ncbi:hypothetical protein K2F43_17900 [Clostridium estertheticum]|uniref:hypothetical protein n=1 Tax=Clostridium estertheticum TaxID=238834 RepID=UPI001C6E3275|nr:hypothetical protein [Clostridium estertheticum]MBW9173071.1 hypothetical protein [Clostridium estertheticum]WLC76164.1 hypothetical protein KTC99_04930 [Clostridium estertheticum]
MHLYSSGTKGLISNMLSAGDYITIDLLQRFESEQFAGGFMHSLEEIRLEYNSSQRINFTTTQDKTFVIGGRQAEKYYGKFEN